MSKMYKLPDGSGCFVGNFPLPKTHWIYSKGDGIEYSPVCTRADASVIRAMLKQAIRGATDYGRDMDFDPDALVNNAILLLCGPL